MKASDRQIGGSHYRDFTIQPSYFCHANELNWLESNAIKYICRHRAKHGRQDIEKAIHYLQLLLEWEYDDLDPADTSAEPVVLELPIGHPGLYRDMPGLPTFVSPDCEDD